MPATIAVVDTETTGDGPEDEVIELAVVALGDAPDFPVERAWSTLVMPRVHVTCVARAAHHIQDDELTGALTMSELQAGRHLDPVFSDERAIFAAHNAEFDQRLMRQSGLGMGVGPPLCTYKLARHLWPDAPSHRNQVLRYWLGIEMNAGPAHRALADARVTASILQIMLREHGLDRLLQLMSEPVLLKYCHIGQWRGREWREVDRGMLQWILHPARDFDVDVRHTARHWLDVKTGRRAA